jgi:hypothetical protein
LLAEQVPSRITNDSKEEEEEERKRTQKETTKGTIPNNADVLSAG